MVILLTCKEDSPDQKFFLRPVGPENFNSSGFQFTKFLQHSLDNNFPAVSPSLAPRNRSTSRIFDLVNPSGMCLVPGEIVRDGKSIRTVVVQDMFWSLTCSGHWEWTLEGQMRWHGSLSWEEEQITCGYQHQASSCAECPRNQSTGQWMGKQFCYGDCEWKDEACVLKNDLPMFEGCPVCVASVKVNYPVTVGRCRALAEDQMVEMGEYNLQDQMGEYNNLQALLPINIVEWQARQDRARQRLLEEAKVTVAEALDEIHRDDLEHLLERRRTGEMRRAVVFYMDMGETVLQQLRWWLKAW